MGSNTTLLVTAGFIGFHFSQIQELRHKEYSLATLSPVSSKGLLRLRAKFTKKRNLKSNGVSRKGSIEADVDDLVLGILPALDS